MGRQFQIYLLPSDAVRVVETLRQRLTVRLLSRRSDNANPVEMESPIVSTQANYTGIDCLLVESLHYSIKMHHVETQRYWSVDTSLSEAIEFTGCFLRPDKKSFDRGRLFFNAGYYNDVGKWQEKSPHFLKWADAVFKAAKRSLKRYPNLDAYVGQDAERWRAEGGVFIKMAIKGRPPMIAK